MKFDDYWTPSPAEIKAREKLRERARVRLNASRKELPRLNKAQAEIIIEMMLAAYEAGAMDEVESSWLAQVTDAKERSQRGVAARREKSRRLGFIKAWNQAMAQNRNVSVAQVAKEEGISRATAYRALRMNRAGKLTW